MNPSVNVMMEEHKNILRMLQVVRKLCYGVMLGAQVPYEDLEQIIDFIRSYSDKHHHGKEEKFLFKEMVDHLGRFGENLISRGMLVEHDYGRMYIQNLEAAMERVKAGEEESRMDIIANAICYTDLLARHIAKEDEVVYTYGANNLPEEIMADVDRLSEEFESAAREQGIQEKYLGLLEAMEAKYIK